MVSLIKINNFKYAFRSNPLINNCNEILLKLKIYINYEEKKFKLLN